jgi:hypothetical protein
MCGTVDPGHTYDEYLVLLAKSGMTSIDLDNPIWSKVFRNKMFWVLSPSTRTQLSLTSLTMGQTMRRYHPGFSTKSGWSLWSKVMGTSDHLRYSTVVGETAMSSWAVSFCFHLDP